tara:strand:- start:154 stop:663 length:510 start_codon:yes stop_codon:yes gene_type:complete
MTEKKRSLIPELPDEYDDGFGDSKTVTANDNIKIFYDEEFGPRFETEILTIYESKRYKKTLPELKDMCKRRKLPVGGNKKELVDRLHEHTEKIKQDKLENKLKEEAQEKKVVDRHKDTALLKIKNNIKRTKATRAVQLAELVKQQEKFDETEKQLREMKATLKTLEQYL